MSDHCQINAPATEGLWRERLLAEATAEDPLGPLFRPTARERLGYFLRRWRGRVTGALSVLRGESVAAPPFWDYVEPDEYDD